MKAKLVLCILVVCWTTPVSAATYYVWQSNRTQKCSVAIRKPLSQNKAYLLVGNDTGYKSRKEATDAIKSIGTCKMGH
jgi:hypothetical protein